MSNEKKELESSKHSLYTGKIQEFKSIIKYIPAKYIKEWAEEGKINEIARDVKSMIGERLVHIPKICNDNCEIKEMCPFYRNNALLVGEICPIEMAVSHELFDELYNDLLKDKIPSMTDKVILSSIVVLYVIANVRMAGILSIDGLKSVGTAKAPGGGTMEVQTVNPLMQEYILVIDQIQRLTKSLHLHRIDRGRYKIDSDKSNSDTEMVDLKTLMLLLEENGVDREKLENVLRRIVHVENTNDKKSDNTVSKDGDEDTSN